MGKNKYTPESKKYFKSNFVELIETITPEVYQVQDLAISGTEIPQVSQVINSHIKVSNNIANVIPLSAVDNTQTSTLDTISGISQYFVKQNELTKINPFLFESKILSPLGTRFSKFDTSGDFNNYLSGTLLPIIIPPSITQVDPLQANMTTLSALTSNADASSVHNYLVDALGWMYFLNTSANGGLDYSPSSYVLDSLNSLFLGKTIETVDGVKGLVEYLWKNNETCSFGSYLPVDFISGIADGITESSAGPLPVYTSGIQRLDALKTLVDVVYSPLYFDQQDFTVKDAFDSYINTSLLLESEVSKGPTRKFNDLLGYNFADITNQVEGIGLLYDIENVPDEYIENIADIIGFRLRGRSPAKWRHQLRIAIDLYKRSGTLAAVQAAIDALIVDSVFDVTGSVQELWESYIPLLIWYALGTESPLFRNLNTWTPSLANETGVFDYNTSSLEENLKLVIDSIMLDLYRKFPENFLFYGEPFPVNVLWGLDDGGCKTKRYTIINEPSMKPFHMHEFGSEEYLNLKQEAELSGYGKAFEVATGMGVLGSGVYMAGETHPKKIAPLYLKPEGDLEFFFNYRGKTNLPLPPFEEVKYYKDSNVSAELVAYLVERLKCFEVNPLFADSVGDYIVSASVTASSDLGTLNEFLMFFSSVQVPSNFDDVMLSISDYEKNLLPLWNGKSSHLFVNFKSDDFDFAKTTMEGDGRYALYEASRVAKEFSPAHAITRVNLTASAEDPLTLTIDAFNYVNFNNEDTRASYTSASVLGNFEYSGVSMGTVSPGDNDGRGGLNTFKRADVDNITDTLLSSTTNVTALSNVGRRALRRRNLKYLLPREGYYDRTGFNGPVTLDPSTFEDSMPSSLGELTLGYVASAGKFYPVVDYNNPSGVWHSCEDLSSIRQFSGVFTSATFPYRGLSALGPGVDYNDRGQLPELYNTMHELFEAKAYDHANEIVKTNWSTYANDTYWKDVVTSLANDAIASGFVLNSFADYENFSFGIGLQKAHRDYCKYFNKHPLGMNELDKTGGNIFAQAFGLGLFNCDFSLAGSAAGDHMIATSVEASAINVANVWNEDAVYDDTGTFIASSTNQSVVPLSGTWVSGNVNNAEYRNPAILSGVEFCDISGAPGRNQFMIFKLDSSNAVPRSENGLVNNTVIKCKSLGGLPRVRFDLSSYGDRRNYFIKDHNFKLNIKSLVADEHDPILGGGRIGVWIHTEPVDGIFWTWTRNKKWEVYNQNKLSIPFVTNTLSHIYTFGVKDPDTEEDSPGVCVDSFAANSGDYINNLSLKAIQNKYFENFEISFDTRNYTVHNNFEYLDIIPMDNDTYKVTEQVHRDDTNYIVEVFFLPNNNLDKYLLIDSIELQDTTQRDQCAIGTGHGVETSGIPLTPFVKEDKIYINKDQLRDIFKFYNGLAGLSTGAYATVLASRDATITSGTLEVSGGSRLNYRIQPDWTPGVVTQANYNNYENVELDN